MSLQKSTAIGVAVVLVFAGAAVAQSGTIEKHEKTRIEVKDGKRVTLTGCVERVGDASAAFILADETGGLKYALVTNDDLAKYVDHRVEVKGNAADRGNGKVKIEHKAEGTTGEKIESKLETKGDNADLPYLALKSIKTIAGSCR